MKKKLKLKPNFEETTLKCVGCGREVKVIKLKDYNVNNFLCQKCGKTK